MVNKPNRPCIVLAGTGSLLNYGCEAIVQGTYNMLQHHWPECELVVASDNEVYDQKLFDGRKNIRFIPAKKRFTPYRIAKGVIRRLGIGSGSPVRLDHKIIDTCDIFLSAGGDNFAQAPDGTLYYILQDLMKMGDRVHKKNKFYTLWGASVGPFNKTNEAIIARHLGKADCLFPRELISYNYLKKLGFDETKVSLIADPAFWMEPEPFSSQPIKKAKSDFVIGLNISPLATYHSFDGKEGTAKIFFAFDFLLRHIPNARFLCIPHVMIDQGGPQDDFTFMQEYARESEFTKRIEVLDFGLGARKTKAVISRCDMLIAARMHCCVAGISSSTPTLFLTYSQKGEGMVEYAYGDLKPSLPIREITGKNLLNRVEMLKNSLDIYKNHLKNQQSRFKSDAALAVKQLQKKFLAQ